MAQYFEDWSGSTIGQAPTGWTQRFAGAGNAWIVSDAGDGTKELLFGTGLSTGVRDLLTFDAVDADPDRANIEIVFKWRCPVATGGPQLKAAGRASGTTVSTTHNAYMGGADTVVDPGTPIRLQKYVAGASSTIGTSAAFEVQSHVWYVTRFRANGTTLQLKVWADGEAEPESWGRTATDTSISAAGWAGLFSFSGQQYHRVAWFGAATAGDTAPTSADPDTTAPTLTSPSATATGTTTASGSVTTNEAGGTLYWLASGNATESVATVKAGSSQAVTAIGAQNVTVSGLTASTPYYLHFVHRDGAGNDSSVATSAQFTTSASGDTTPPTLTGAINFTSVTQTSYIPNWPTGSDNVGVIGYEYQIGGTAGAWTDAGNNLSAVITGRTAGATETVYVRAYDAAGLRSTPAISGEVTLESAPVLTKKLRIDETIYTDKAKTTTFSGAADVTVLDRAATRAIVYQANSVTITAGSIDITNAAFDTLAAQFDVVLVVSGTVRGVFPATVVED